MQPKEVLGEAVKLIEEKNPKLNAVIHKLYEKADKQLKHLNIEGVFAGVPFVLKDITQEIEGGGKLRLAQRHFKHTELKLILNM
ncbi:hypothetical protein [Neobacillus mesonae]|uniref:hypothetical protein n=1 Tax=Neobacillus mesonae TaxID=1193713 RepID=UPI002E24F00A